jgi:hypothetical protein
METRKFTCEDQEIFAKLSGDYNPVHLDEMAARRFQFGQPIVHGTHLLLWALDCWLKCRQKSIELCSLNVDFKKPVVLNEDVRCFFSSQGDDGVRIELSIEDSVVVVIQARWSPSKPGLERKLRQKYPDRRDCKVLSPDEITGASGELDLCINVEEASMLFPDLIKNMPLKQLAELLAITRLVGMECPGYHSILSALDVSFIKNSDDPFILNYKVSGYHKRFSLLSISLCGPSLRGLVKAFFRPPPEKQESFSSLRAKVDNKEFEGQNALIIGGSRGLGEVSAKLLAAGGADVKLTYFRGEEDARRVVKEIVSGGGSVDCMPFNILNTEENLPDKPVNEIKPTHLYYFATPAIFAVRYKKNFSPKLFENFCGYYVTGFAATVGIFRGISPGLAGIFYPSSTAVDELLPSLTEYACAKAAGEILCALLEKQYKGLSVYMPRLPRMPTDQTASLLPVESQDPAAVILRHLRVFRDSGRYI